MRKYRRQEPPHSVSIELAEGCNLRCPFCGLNGIRTPKNNDYKFMALDVIDSFTKQMVELNWRSRVGFAMRGEPTMHPHCLAMVQTARRNLPHHAMLMLTNGGGLLGDSVAKVKALLAPDALTVLGLDDYQTVNIVPKIIQKIEQQIGVLENGKYYEKLGFIYYEYPEDLRGNPHARHKEKTLVRVRDLSVEEKEGKRGNHNRLSNHAGAGRPLNDRMAGKRCALPFRQFAVHWDGSVFICCNDWRGEYYCGNILKEGVDAIWQGDAMNAAREMLYHGKREMRPCHGCDHRSFRVGLLPDPLGKKKLHRPDEQTAEHVKQALAAGPHTKPVLRPWEEIAQHPKN